MMVLRSPYIAGITLWVSLLSVAATFLYFEQAAIVAAASDDPAVRTRIFAAVDLAVGLLTLAVQFFATGKLIARFGVGPALALAAARVRGRLRGARRVAGAGRGDRLPGAAAHRELRHLQSRARGAVHGASRATRSTRPRT